MTLSKKEAIAAMLDGKKVRPRSWDKVRPRSWDKDRYLYLNNHDQFCDTDDFPKDINYMKYTEWELYEEPKKKKTLTFTRPKYFLCGNTLNTSCDWKPTKEEWLSYYSCVKSGDEWETIEIEV